MSTLEIRRATTEADRQAVYAFRYSVIVTELQVMVPTANRERRTVADPEDQTGHLFAAFEDGAVVGTGRVNFLRDGLVEPHATLLGFTKLSRAERDVVSVSSRYLVAADRRGSTVAGRIMHVWYPFCRAAGVEWDYILVKPELGGMYRRLGWLPYGAPVRHPEVGEVVPMRLHLNDEDHLRSISSPLVRCLISQQTSVSAIDHMRADVPAR